MITALEITDWLKELQDKICSGLEVADGKSRFREDIWEREEGGGGRTRVIEDGFVFEKGGVNFSAVHGTIPPFLLKETKDCNPEDTFLATGVSIVIHPVSPHVPIIHMNIRYFEMSNGLKWLGGGIDLTPIYVNKDDAAFFHNALKKLCDKHDANYYEDFKKWADEYFYLGHRKETRGIGGLFFDKLRSNSEEEFRKQIDFWKEVGECFLSVYLPIVAKNKLIPITENNIKWQLLRRGRYVEFNLVYDKGTKFGLETNGRIESILMSLPKHASWVYNYIPEKNSEEEKTLQFLKKGIVFIN